MAYILKLRHFILKKKERFVEVQFKIYFAFETMSTPIFNEK